MPTDYSFYYWPLPFRGHFIRYLLAHVGATWDERPVQDLLALKTAAVSDQPLPFMAPPLLRDHQADFWLSQHAAILAYLGRKHGLMPGDPARDALTLKILSDAGDVLEELTRNCGAAMWTQADWEVFASGRLPSWMQIFEETGRRHGLTAETGTMLGTPEPGLADLATAALWFTMADKLPRIGALLERHAPRVAGLSRRISELPEIAALRRDHDARHGNFYCGGEIEKSLRSVLSGD